MFWVAAVDLVQLGIAVAVLIGMQWEPALAELSPWLLAGFAALGGSEENFVGVIEAGGGALCIALLLTGGESLAVAILVLLSLGQIAELVHLAGPGFFNGLLQVAGTVFRIRGRLRGWQFRSSEE